MSNNHLSDLLEQGKTALGLCNMYPASGIIEGMCHGWDYVWIDGQHGEFSYDTVLHAMQACSSVGVSVLLRVPAYDSSLIGPYADLDPEALMIPMVNTVAEAEKVVQLTRFAPLGSRSYGGRRVIDRNGREYYKERKQLVIAQVETVESVENAEKIARIEGIDGFFFGPDDMKVQMGIPVNTPPLKNDKLKDAMKRTADAALAAGKICACIAVDAESLAQVKEMGYRMIVGGADVIFMRMMADEKLKILREADAQNTAAKGGKGTGGGVY